MPKIGANFVFDSTSPNFERDRFDTLAEMKAYNIIDDGHQSYCAETGNRYEFKSTNEPDNTLGKWRLVKTSIDAASSSNLGGIKLGFSQANKNYPVVLDDQNRAYVSVPWEAGIPYTPTAATSGALGCIKIGYQEVSGVKKYAVKLDSEKAYVEVPWTDTTYSLPQASSSALGGIKIGSFNWSQWNDDYCYAIQAIVSGEFAGHTYIVVPNAGNTSYGTVKTSDSTQFTTDVADSTKKDSFVPTLLAVKNYVDNAVSGVTVGAATSSALGTIKIGYTESDTNRAVKLASDKAYIELQYASSSHGGIIKLGYALTDDSVNSVVKYPLSEDSNKGYTSIPYADKTNRGIVKLSDSSTIDTDITNNDDTKAVTPKAVGVVAAAEAATALNAKIWVGTQAQYGAIASKDASVLYFVYNE